MTEQKISMYPYRPPKKYTKKSLHGRVRSANIPYEDVERIRKFYYHVFGWDMFRLPKNVLGRNPAEETPDICCACGPAGASWECIVPGYLSVVLVHNDPGYEKPYVMMEVDMEVSLQETLNRVTAKGGRVLGGSGNSGDWAEVAMIEDPSGNRILLWKCPDSRTWQEPETDYDRE